MEPWCLLIMSFIFPCKLFSTSARTNTTGMVRHLFWISTFSTFMNISTLRSIRDGD